MQKEKNYKMYITDALKVIGENTAGGNKRSSLTKRWIEIVEPPKINKRSANEIINRFRKRFE